VGKSGRKFFLRGDGYFDFGGADVFDFDGGGAVDLAVAVLLRAAGRDGAEP